MTSELMLSPAPELAPAPIFAPTPKAARRTLEFFTAQINNDHVATTKACHSPLPAPDPVFPKCPQ